MLPNNESRTETSLETLSPESLWRYFQLLCDTPRPSNEEALLKKRIREELAGHPIEIIEDEVGNLILKKPATVGHEEAPGVILQSHLDMVAQQNEGTGHNFSTDPIRTCIAGDWVTATGTTLGADNGIGVAAILAVMTSETLVHGPLEAILTINEESGMTGAKGLQPGLLKGRYLLNLDTEEEGELYIGCAGGVDITGYLPCDEMAPDESLRYLAISLKGLKGGHSGIDIHRGRGNAIRLLARIVQDLKVQIPGLTLADFRGGSLRNAIPREAFAVIAVMPMDAERVNESIDRWQQCLTNELGTVEAGLALSLADAETRPLLPPVLSERLMNTLVACPHGVFRMSPDFDGVTETSNNLASVTIEDHQVRIECLARSLVNSARDDAANSVASVLRLAGAEVKVSGHYPGWAPDKDSALLADLTDLHTRVMGVTPKIQVIHAGLECGILGANYPAWEMISFGPTIRGAHSPDEAVNIRSVATFWDFLAASLRHLAEV